MGLGTLQPPSTQNLQMIRSELHEEYPNVDIMIWSGIMIGDGKGNIPEESTWVLKAPIKEQ